MDLKTSVKTNFYFMFMMVSVCVSQILKCFEGSQEVSRYNKEDVMIGIYRGIYIEINIYWGIGISRYWDTIPKRWPSYLLCILPFTEIMGYGDIEIQRNIKIYEH